MRGDWICGTCLLLNFSWRTKCHRCEEPFVGLSKVLAPRSRVHSFKPGDWLCDSSSCHAHNYAKRVFCYRCGAPKSIPSVGGPVRYVNPAFPPIIDQRYARISRRGWMTGDWFCGRPECNAHNYGDRVRCYKCNCVRELVINTPT